MNRGILRGGLLVLVAVVAAGAPAAFSDEGSAARQGTPVRVATLLPYVEDALGAIEGPYTVVASVRRSLTKPVSGAADLGNPHSPSFEVLAAARPDLVVGDIAIHGPLADRLAVGSAAVKLVDARSIEATFAGLEEVGERVRAAVPMRRATDRARERLRGLRLQEPVEVLALFGVPGAFRVITDRTWLGDLLETLAFRNVAGDVQGDERFPGLVALDDEALAALRPQLILLVAHGDPRALRAALEDRLRGPWRGVRAAASYGVHVLDPTRFAANPGLGLPDAAESLVALTEGAPTAAHAPTLAGARQR